MPLASEWEECHMNVLGDPQSSYSPLQAHFLNGEDTRGLKCALGAMSLVLGVGSRKDKGPWRKTVEG